jgi:heterodisulfide reductase subunit A-like polyferredoxin
MYDEHTSSNITSVPGVFVTGTAAAPQTISTTVMDGRSAAVVVNNWLSKEYPG